MARIVQVQAGQSNVILPGQAGAGTYTANDKVILTERQYAQIADAAFTSILTDLGPGILASAPVNLSGATVDGATVATITPGLVGKLGALFAIVTTAASTAAKTATFGAYIDGVDTGARLTLTSALATPAGKVVGNAGRAQVSSSKPAVFSATGVVTIKIVGTPTAFVEGTVVFGLLLAANTQPGPMEA